MSAQHPNAVIIPDDEIGLNTLSEPSSRDKQHQGKGDFFRTLVY